MESSKKINITYIKQRKLIWLIVIFIALSLSGMSLIIFLLFTFPKSTILLTLVLGLILFVIIPMIVISRLNKIFAVRGIIELTNKFLRIDNINSYETDNSNNIIVNYESIKDYRLGKSDDSKSSICELILRSGKKFSYVFFQQTQNEEDHVTETIHKFIHNYNQTENCDKIILKPSFFASRKGQICVNIVGLLMILLIVTLIFYKPSTIPFSSIGGALLYFKARAQQKSDLEFYNKYKQ